MNQPNVYPHQEILEAAIQVIRIKGHEQLTARAIAGELGSSTMPIYSRMKSLRALEDQLQIHVRGLLLAEQSKQATGDPLLDAAFGYVRFARDEQNLFRFLFGCGALPPANDYRTRFLADFSPDSAAGQELLHMPEAVQDSIILNAWIYAHGLAMLLNSSSLAMDDTEILRRLQSAGQAFYTQEVSP
ncbi:TetR/AcrR family transcriptional regulator [Spirochaeta africana]|uniref:Uncharacterized protein n=1 Tax=Spirochaeta africana (strain ATCC 700263 / DSM 8902 / Z-7692) TaxID=889378 RepID=H9UHE5_SPIAZ|nr:WHG domain-containing protein [Spirochaeta africana]AFG36938.1 hypothetical protein Spiaf_0846 [Spirochaeta africana DSM 8902]